MEENPKPQDSSFERQQFASSLFLAGLIEFIRRKEGNNTALLESKPGTLSCLSPEVSARLQAFTRPPLEYQSCPNNTDARPKQRQTRTDDSILVAPAPDSDSEHNAVVTIDEMEDGRIVARIDWPRVNIPPRESANALAEGVRLALLCHTALSRHCFLDTSTASTTSNLGTAGVSRDSGQQQRMWPTQRHRQHLANANVGDLTEGNTLPFASALPRVITGIVKGSAEDALVCLCVCLTILEKALYNISREEPSPPLPQSGTSEEQSGLGKTTPYVLDADVGGGGGDGDAGGEGEVVGPAMILRDIIATPQVKAAFPEQLVAVLRLLLLPLSFNIRNLVWHGFLAPAELPRELASFVLAVTLNMIPHVSVPALMAPMPWKQRARRSGWTLESFDHRLRCPSTLLSAMKALLGNCSRRRKELEDFIRSSAFVFPGREGLALFALEALREGRDVLCLVALLPVLEHGLRCLFSCANDSPGHLFAQLHQYYSTLDGFGQRARHQLLLDQNMAGYPDRPNLLLLSLGPGLSACLLDIFMMDAGPGLRGKVAHAEVDMSNVFCVESPASLLHGTDFRSRRHSDLVILTVATFLVLCHRYNATTFQKVESYNSRPNPVNGKSGGYEEPGVRNSSPALRGGTQAPKPLLSFKKALATCDDHLKEWVPRFHPHELLESDMQACWHEFDRLALMLEMRAVSVKPFSANEGSEGLSTLARMTVVVSTGRSAIGSGKAGKIGTKCGQSEDLRLASKNGGQPGSEDKRKTNAHLILTVTDTAHRLILPAVAGRREDMGGMRLSGKDATDAVKKNQGTGGLLSVAVRVRGALCEHTTRLITRFQRMVGTTAGGEMGDRNVYGASHKPCNGKVSPTATRLATTQPDSGKRTDSVRSPVESDFGLSSAFSPYMHSLQCHGGVSVCRLGCLDPTWTSSGHRSVEGGTDHAVGNVTSGVRLPARGEHKMSNMEGGITSDEERRSESEARSLSVTDELVFRAKPREGLLHGNGTNISFHDGAAGNDTGVSARGDDDGGQRFPSQRISSGKNLPVKGKSTVRTGIWLKEQVRTPRRISPSTNVVNVFSLPQIGCLAGLCRSSSNIARGLAARIIELEREMTSGTARSGQRRAYAATLMVAPTLLCFLAQTVVTVEAFVLEWDTRNSVTAASGISGHAPTVDNDQDRETIGHRGSTVSCPRASKRKEKRDESIGERRSGGEVRSIHEELKKPGGASSSVVADQLSFLRRLTAVIGALGLCVSVIDADSSGQCSDGNVVKKEEEDTSSSNVSTPVIERTGRKGYVQALTELAVFLETKIANRGFSGRGSV